MCTTPDKIKIFIAIMLIVRSEISHLHKIMPNTSKNRASGNIAGAFPALGGIANFKFNMFFYIFKSKLFKPVDKSLSLFFFSDHPSPVFSFCQDDRHPTINERVS